MIESPTAFLMNDEIQLINHQVGSEQSTVLTNLIFRVTAALCAIRAIAARTHIRISRLDILILGYDFWFCISHALLPPFRFRCFFENSKFISQISLRRLREHIARSSQTF
jgi:hypothetical protein